VSESGKHAARLERIVATQPLDPNTRAALRAGAEAIRENVRLRAPLTMTEFQVVEDNSRLRERVEEYEDLFRCARDGAVVHFNGCVIELAPAADKEPPA
jgi:hypothetical protein